MEWAKNDSFKFSVGNEEMRKNNNENQNKSVAINETGGEKLDMRKAQDCQIKKWYLYWYTYFTKKDNTNVTDMESHDKKNISPSCKSIHSVLLDIMELVHEHPHKPTFHNMSDETSFGLGTNNLEQNVSSENEKVAIEQAYDQSVCLTIASWFAPTL